MRHVGCLVACFVVGFAGAQLLAAPGAMWKCQGTFNCYGGVPCQSPGVDEDGGGISCMEMSPVNHPKCQFTGSETDSCTTVQKNCVRIDMYAGGTCNMNACPHDFPLGNYFQQEDGC